MTIQGAIAELQNLINAEDIPCYYKGGIKKVIETIQMDLPIEPKRPKGEWERISFPDGEVMECTNCGYRDWVDVWEEESRNFCPNCGADMRGDME